MKQVHAGLVIDQRHRRSFTLFSLSLKRHVTFISVTQRPPKPPWEGGGEQCSRRRRGPQPLPPIVIIHRAQAISVTMGRFPKRSGVDAKLSEGSLFDLLLPIYKHTSAAAGEGGRERERCREGEKRWPPFRRISCVGSLYVRLYSPTSIICIHTGDTSCERNVLATLLPPPRL